MMKKIPEFLRRSPLLSCFCNLLLVYVVYLVARVEFLLENHSFFARSLSEGHLWHIIVAGAVFDTPGIFYTNALYVLLMLLPLHLKERSGYHLACKIWFVTVNTLAFAVNLMDSVYFPFSHKRTTWDAVAEFGHESNLGSVFGVELVHHWYLVLLLAVVAWGMWRLYVTPRVDVKGRPKWEYYLLSTCGLIFAACVCVGGIRGGWLRHWWCYVIAVPLLFVAWELLRRRPLSKASRWGGVACSAIAAILFIVAPIGGWRHRDIRPVALSNANAYALLPIETSAILNTPFSLIRTVNSNAFENPGYFVDSAEMARIYSPEHPGLGDTASFKPRNVVVLILESFGEEYVGELNRRVMGERSVGYAPFMDSLARKSMRFETTYNNGTKSIDAMPSILASIPKLGKPFILTSSAMQPVDALPALLRKEGYETAFFHGARTGSMGFDGFAKLTGFDHYYGREDFDADPRFGGEAEFDGYWAVWDAPFMQYYAEKMGEMKEPFMTAIFSATSHHPFHVPEKYEGKFPKGTLPIHQCIGYTDMAIREFFETASKQPWYRNTLFVITDDHTNAHADDEYRSDIGTFHGPLLFFDPSGELFGAGVCPGVVQQADIMPTVLGLLGYGKPYVAYGKDMTVQNPEDSWAVNSLNDVYQLVRGGKVLQFDGHKSIGLYDESDWKMTRNRIGEPQLSDTVKSMETFLKAFVQTYMERKGR